MAVVNTKYFHEHHSSVARNGCILLLEDEPDHLERWAEFLSRHGWDVYAFPTDKHAHQVLDSGDTWDSVDIAVLDWDLPTSEATCIEFAKNVREKSNARIQCVVLTGQSSSVSRAEILRAGRAYQLFDFFEKDKDEERLLTTLSHLQKIANLEREVQQLQRERLAPHVSKDIIRTHLKDLDDRIRLYIGPSLMNVLIIGDTGTTKEHTAKLIHLASGLAHLDGSGKDRYWNFQALNCAGLNDNLLISHLFGHLAGSFTGAYEHRIGKVLMAAGLRHVQSDRRANASPPYDRWLASCAERGLRDLMAIKRERGNTTNLDHTAEDEDGYIVFPQLERRFPGKCGTLFLDEVAELSPYAQAALLRFLDGNGFDPHGWYGNSLLPKVRIIAATNRFDRLFHDAVGENDVKDSLMNREFRPDLLWRLMEWVIKLPPISEREKEPILVAENTAAELPMRPPFTHHQEKLKIAPEALTTLEKWVSEERRFSGDSPTRSGNYRSLRALVRRAAWIAATSSGVKTRPEITEDVLEEAAKMYIDIDIKLDEKKGDDGEIHLQNDAGTADVGALKRLVVDTAKYLGDSGRIHEVEKFTDGDDNVERDIALAGSLCEMLSHTGHGIHQKELFRQPEKALDSPMPASPRWQYLCTLGVLGAAYRRESRNPYSWKELDRVFGSSKFSRDAFKDRFLTRLLEAYKIRIFWSSSRNIDGPAAGFLRLCHHHSEGIIQPFEMLPPETHQHNDEWPQFYWSQDVSDAQKEAAYKFLEHLAKIADALDLPKPWPQQTSIGEGTP